MKVPLWLILFCVLVIGWNSYLQWRIGETEMILHKVWGSPSVGTCLHVLKDDTARWEPCNQ